VYKSTHLGIGFFFDRLRGRGAGFSAAPPHVVRDANGRALAYVHCRVNETEALQAKGLTRA